MRQQQYPNRPVPNPQNNVPVLPEQIDIFTARIPAEGGSRKYHKRSYQSIKRKVKKARKTFRARKHRHTRRR